MPAYCPYCMSLISSGMVCPDCGAELTSYHPASHHFPMGHLLHDRYLVGSALGEGGFGITYLGLDTTLERRVAIKEYFPNMFVHRETSISLDVTCYEGEKRTLYEKGRDQFLQEARVMARFDDYPGIVHVLDFFPAYNTAYIVMELLAGDTLRTLLTRKKRIPAKYLLDTMQPMLHTLYAIHKAGIIHRDISPDNIILLNNGQVKLLDFGCARDVDKDHTMTVMLKHGYAPIEQYTGYHQGPWTDIYALCATLYHCLTGKALPKALERMAGQDTLLPPGQLGADLTPKQEKTIMRGLEIQPEKRWQSIADLYQALYGTAIEDSPKEKPLDKTELVEEETNPPPNDKKQNIVNAPADAKAENDSKDIKQSERDKKTNWRQHHKDTIETIFAVVFVPIIMLVVLISCREPIFNLRNGVQAILNKPFAYVDVLYEYDSGMERFDFEEYDEALSHFLTAAEMGHTGAMEMIYQCWLKDRVIEEEDAVKWLQKAAENGSPYAANIVAIRIYANNDEYDTAIDMLTKAAETGDSNSMYDLGNIYMYGKEYDLESFKPWTGVEIDEQKAVKWYIKAAEAGHSSSMRKLAECYHKGVGTEKNPELALYWYKKSAVTGNPTAMIEYYELTDSNLYDNTPVSENYKEGLAAYSANSLEAAERFEQAYQSDNDKQGLLGLYSMTDWFEVWAHLGDSSGADWLVKTANGMSQSNCEDFGETDQTEFAEKIQKIYNKAAKCGSKEAVSGMYKLALQFDEHSRFFDKWMKRAAELGSEEAKAFLN